MIHYNRRKEKTEPSNVNKFLDGNVLHKQDECISDMTDNVKHINGVEEEKKSYLSRIVEEETVNRARPSKKQKRTKIFILIKSKKSTAMPKSRGTKQHIGWKSQILNDVCVKAEKATRPSRKTRRFRSTQKDPTECANFTFTIKYEDEYRVWKNFSIMYQGRMYHDYEYRTTDDGLQVCRSMHPLIQERWRRLIFFKKTMMASKQCNVSVDGFYQENYTLYKNLTVFLKPTRQSFARGDYGVVFGHFVVCSAKLSLSCNDYLLEVKNDERFSVSKNFSLFYNEKIYDYREYRFNRDSLEICSSNDPKVQAIWKTRNSWEKFKHVYQCHGWFFKLEIPQDYILNKQFTVYFAANGQFYPKQNYAVENSIPYVCQRESRAITTKYTQEDLSMCNDSIIIKYHEEYKVWDDFSILYKNEVYDHTDYRVLNDSIKICNSGDNFVRSVWKLRTTWVKRERHFNSCINSTKNVSVLKGFYTVHKDFKVVLFPSLQVVTKDDYGVFEGKLTICFEKLLYPTVRDLKIYIAPLSALALSFLCSLMLLIVYCMISELRTLPGLNLMSLTFALLLWQINQIVYFSLFMRLGIVHKVPCAATITASKFPIYSTLMNVAVSIYHLKKTFCGKTLVKSDENKWKTFLRYSLFAWGVPVVITVVYIALVKKKIFRFEQVPLTGACIRHHPSWSVIIDQLGLPFGILLGIIVMFSYTAYRIRQKLKASNSITQKSNIVKSRKSFILLLKLCSTAFISCTPFLYQMVLFDFYTRVAVLTITWLSGVYVGIAFVFTKRNYRLVKKKYFPVKK